MIEIESINKSYTMGKLVVPVLNDVSLRIEAGEFVAIMGQSGSGKSTLLHILGLLDRPDSGTFRFAGQDVSKLDDNGLAALRSEKIGFVFQQFHLLRRTTALDNVNLPLVYSDTLPGKAGGEQLLARVGLSERKHHRPNELSGGQQQRVAIARSLIRHPRVLLADEPTGNLDSTSGREILGLFRELNSEGITVILVTHEPTVASVTGRTIHITDGRISSDERHGDIVVAPGFSAPAKRESASYLLRNLYRIGTHFHQAARALLLNKLRTALSALGIIIGVSAVVTMLALGKGAEQSITKQLASLGSNRLVVRTESQRIGRVSQQIGGTTRLSVLQVKDITNSVDTVKAAAPVVRQRAQAAWGNANVNTEIVGTTPSYVDIYAIKPAAGRFFTDAENEERARVAILGRTVAKNLFGESNPVGETVQINKTLFQVIGVMNARGASGARDEDDVIVIPLETAMRRVMGKLFVDYIDVSARDSESVEEAQEGIRALFASWPRLPGASGPGYRIDNLASVQQAFTSIIRTLSLLLAAIAAISLFVGGIGIMNIMLVSVTERTREIGLRKAIGARNGDVLIQFLIEAITLCLCGGVIGIALGAGLVAVIAQLMGWPLRITATSAMLACGFSALVGIVFGLWPAKKASELNPIEALRHE